MKELKKVFKYSTFYAAANGGNSLSDANVYSVTSGLQTTKVETPFDYSLAFGVRKIASNTKFISKERRVATALV